MEQAVCLHAVSQNAVSGSAEIQWLHAGGPAHCGVSGRASRSGSGPLGRVTGGATEQVETVQQEISQAAAEANAAATKMSWKAQRERKAREDATDKHLPE